MYKPTYLLILILTYITLSLQSEPTFFLAKPKLRPYQDNLKIHLDALSHKEGVVSIPENETSNSILNISSQPVLKTASGPTEPLKEENPFGIKLPQFVPGTQLDINGATFLVNPQEILVISDEGLKDLKFGVEILGEQAIVLGSWVPVGTIDKLPDREKLRIYNGKDMIEIDLKNGKGIVTLINIKINGEDILYDVNEEHVTILVESNQEEDQVKIDYKGNKKQVNLIKDMKSGEVTLINNESQGYEFQTRYIDNYGRPLDMIDIKGQAVIRKMDKGELERLQNAQAMIIKDNNIDIIVQKRMVKVFQGLAAIRALELEKKEVVQLLGPNREIIKVVLTPVGEKEVSIEVVVNGESLISKDGEEITIKVMSLQTGTRILIQDNGKNSIEERDIPLEKSLPMPVSYIVGRSGVINE